MTTTDALEQRLTLLEQQVQQMQTRLSQDAHIASGRTAPDFLERFVGIFAHDPTFDEAVRLGRAWRTAEPIPDSVADET